MSLYDFEKNDLTYSSIDNNNSCDLIEKEYQKLQIELLKKDKEIQALKSELSIFKTSNNNTSSQFPLPSEFKDQWFNFIQFTLMESFDAIFFNKIILSIVVQVSLKAIYSMTTDLIYNRLSCLLSNLGINEVNDSMIQYFYIKYKRILLQEYYKTLFKLDDDFIKRSIDVITKELFDINPFKFDYRINDKRDILNDLSNKEINGYIKEGFDLCLYMNLHEPPLILLVKNKVEYCYYSKKDYVNIEGFIQDNNPCLIVLSPPMIKENMPFNGLKAAICVCDNITEDIISQCKWTSNTSNKNKPKLLIEGYENETINAHNNNSKQKEQMMNSHHDDLIEGDVILRNESTKYKTVFNSELSNHLIEQNKACSSTNIFSNSLLPNSNENCNSNDDKSNDNNNNLIIQQKNNSTSNLIAIKNINQTTSQSKAMLNDYISSDEDKGRSEIRYKSGNNNNHSDHLQHHLIKTKSRLNNQSKLHNRFIYSKNWFWLSRNSTDHAQYNSYTNFNKYQIIKPPDYTLNTNKRQIDFIPDLNDLKTPLSKVKKFTLYSLNNNNNKTATNNHISNIEKVASNTDSLSKTIPTSNVINNKKQTKTKNKTHYYNNNVNLKFLNEIELRRATLNYNLLENQLKEKLIKYNETIKAKNKSKNKHLLKTSCSFKNNKQNNQPSYDINLRIKSLYKTKKSKIPTDQNDNKNKTHLSEKKYKPFSKHLEYTSNHIKNNFQDHNMADDKAMSKREWVILTNANSSSNRYTPGTIKYNQLNNQGNTIENAVNIFKRNHCQLTRREKSSTNRKDNNIKLYFNTISFDMSIPVEIKTTTANKNTNQTKQNKQPRILFVPQSKSKRRKSFPLKYVK